jgi:hypothetical protein
MKAPSKPNLVANFRAKVAQLLAFVETELSTFDSLKVVKPTDPNDSFLCHLVTKLKALDESTISKFLRQQPALYQDILASSEVRSEANIIEGRVFSKRGSPKKAGDQKLERRRRQSFAATSYGNVEIILSTEGILEMSDLNFLFSLNAFFLPYCDSDRTRNMYEHFFDHFLKAVQKHQPPSPGFQLLQHSIMIIQNVSESWMNALEVILEMLDMAFTRLKTHEVILSPGLKTSFNSECEDDVELKYRNLIDFVTSLDKIYRMIGTGHLTDVNSRRPNMAKIVLKPDGYVDKIEAQLEALHMAREVHLCLSQSSLSIAEPFADEFPDFVGQLKLYIQTFMTFSDSLYDPCGVFQTFVSTFVTTCRHFEVAETNLNTVLESPRRSPKENKWFSPRKSSESPRENKEK